jgi:hypothetical protein
MRTDLYLLYLRTRARRRHEPSRSRRLSLFSPAEPAGERRPRPGTRLSHPSCLYAERCEKRSRIWTELGVGVGVCAPVQRKDERWYSLRAFSRLQRSVVRRDVLFLSNKYRGSRDALEASYVFCVGVVVVTILATRRGAVVERDGSAMLGSGACATPCRLR